MATIYNRLKRPKPKKVKSTRKSKRRVRKISRNIVLRASRVKNRCVIIKYIEKDGRIPKLDSFIGMKEGTLVKTIDEIHDARNTRPSKRSGYKNFKHLEKVSEHIPQGTKMMFIKRHPFLKEYYQFCPVGGAPLWVDISDYLDSLTIMRNPNNKKSKSSLD